MNFQEALAALKAGKAVRRAMWDDRAGVLTIPRPDEKGPFSGKPFVIMTSPMFGTKPWCPYYIDFDASDWMAIETAESQAKKTEDDKPSEGWTDEFFLGYCEEHSKTERALFSAEHCNRLLVLAGEAPNPDLKGFYALRNLAAQPLIDRARERLKTPG